jgi:serine phosphatase RsbU (regulator of sigma subunit)
MSLLPQSNSWDIDGDTVLFAAADCTGHGVPGAIISVICHNALNQSVKKLGITQPNLILENSRDLVIETFAESNENVQDGMDIALCALNTKTNEMQYAGANNPIWIIKKEATEIEEIKANKQPIGKYDLMKPFTNHTIQLDKGDTIYIFSDGYIDQFGGERGKKFKTKAFKALLLSIQEKPMEEQQKMIDESFEKWKGNLEQIDDVCVIGLRI